jgi:3D (Asp-Asp-Asp) domain-containing protein
MKPSRSLMVFVLMFLPSIVQAQDSMKESIRSFHVPPVNIADLREVDLWATNYYVYEASAVKTGIPLLDMQDKELGPKLSPRDWCLGSIEGTIRVEGITYNYEDTKPPQQVDCVKVVNFHVGANRYKRATGAFGDGTQGYKLVPWRTVAVDPKIVAFGTLLFVPDAVGQKMPDGSIHDGFFFAADEGGKIRGWHIDVFTGTSEKPAFSIISSSQDEKFKAFVVKDPQLTKAFDEVHR